MNKTGAFIAGILAGCGIGYFAGKRVSDEECEERIRSEVKSVKDAFKRRRAKEKAKDDIKDAIDKTFDQPKKEEKKSEADHAEKERVMTDYRTRANQYANDAMKEEDEIRQMAEKLKPRVIDPKDVGENEEYGDPIELNFFEDGVLMNEEERPMGPKDIEDCVGTDFASHFGEYEDDAVYIVNDRLKSYFVILKNNNTYERYKAGRPYLNQE